MGLVKPPTQHENNDHDLVRVQLQAGVVLVLFGAAVAVAFGVMWSDRDINKVSLAIGTAVIGVGAALLPPGAAAAASARILGSLPTASGRFSSPDVVTSPPRSTLEPKVVEFGGVVAPNGLATTYWFTYGTTATTLTKKTPEQDAGSGSASVAVSATPTDVKRDADLFYQLWAKNERGTTIGEPQKLDKGEA